MTTPEPRQDSAPQSPAYADMGVRELYRRLADPRDELERAAVKAELDRRHPRRARRPVDPAQRSARGKLVLFALGALAGTAVFTGLNKLEEHDLIILGRIVNAAIGLVVGLGVLVVAGVRHARGWWPRLGLLALMLLLTMPLATCSLLLYAGAGWGR